MKRVEPLSQLDQMVVGDTVKIAPEHVHSYTGKIVEIDVKKRELSVHVSACQEASQIGAYEVAQFHDVATINDDPVLTRLLSPYGWHPETARVVDIGTAQINERRPMTAVLWDMLGQMSKQAQRERVRRVRDYVAVFSQSGKSLLAINEFNEIWKGSADLYQEAVEHAEILKSTTGLDEFQSICLEEAQTRLRALQMDQKELKKLLDGAAWYEA